MEYFNFSAQNRYQFYIVYLSIFLNKLHGRFEDRFCVRLQLYTWKVWILMLYAIQLILGTKANATKNSRGWQIVGLRRAGFTQNEIFRDLNIRQGTVSKILRRHSQRGTVKPKASSGRPR